MNFDLPLKKNTTRVTGIGSALMDMLLLESHEFCAQSGADVGGMKLVDSTIIESVLSKSSKKPVVVSGGSACNTIVGIGRLGGPARFIGKRKKDDLGKLFEADLKKNNVDPVLFSSLSTPTGRVLSIVTPDAQRSMMTFLGASSEASPADILSCEFSDTALVHIEGYLLFNESLMMASLKAAKNAGAVVSLDLASYTVVEASGKILPEIIGNYVDIVIANEDESRAYTGIGDERASLELLAKQAAVAVVKLGKRGSLVAHKGKTTVISPTGSGSVVDTTGAGDLWAAGFLYGISHGMSVEKSGELASVCGYEVCRVVGAHIPDEGWKRIIKNHKPNIKSVLSKIDSV